VPVLVLALCTLIWGLTFVVVKDALSESDAFTFLALRIGTDVAQQVLNEVNAALSGRVVTELTSLDNYSAAEVYHQDYFEHNPNQGYCAFVVAPKVQKFVKTFAYKVKQG
jgi:hypothetical protein